MVSAAPGSDRMGTRIAVLLFALASGIALNLLSGLSLERAGVRGVELVLVAALFTFATRFAVGRSQDVALFLGIWSSAQALALVIPIELPIPFPPGWPVRLLWINQPALVMAAVIVAATLGNDSRDAEPVEQTPSTLAAIHGVAFASSLVFVVIEFTLLGTLPTVKHLRATPPIFWLIAAVLGASGYVAIRFWRTGARLRLLPDLIFFASGVWTLYWVASRYLTELRFLQGTLLAFAVAAVLGARRGMGWTALRSAALSVALMALFVRTLVWLETYQQPSLIAVWGILALALASVASRRYADLRPTTPMPTTPVTTTPVPATTRIASAVRAAGRMRQPRVEREAPKLLPRQGWYGSARRTPRGPPLLVGLAVGVLVAGAAYLTFREPSSTAGDAEARADLRTLDPEEFHLIPIELEKEMDFQPEPQWSPDGGYLYLATRSGELLQLEAETLTLVRTLWLRQPVTDLAICKDFIFALSSGGYRVFVVHPDLMAIQATIRLSQTSKPGRVLASRGCETVMVVGKKIDDFQILDAGDARVSARWSLQSILSEAALILGEKPRVDPLREVALDAGGKRLFAASHDTLYRFRIDGKTIRFDRSGIELPDGWAGLTLSGDGTYVALASTGSTKLYRGRKVPTAMIFRQYDIQSPASDVRVYGIASQLVFDPGAPERYLVIRVVNGREHNLTVVSADGELRGVHPIPASYSMGTVAAHPGGHRLAFVVDRTAYVAVLPH